MGSFTRRATLAALAATPVLGASARACADVATPPTIDEFAKKPVVRGAAMSPDGKHIAVIKQLGDGKTTRTSFLDLLNVDNPALRRGRVILGTMDVSGVTWGANDRLLISVVYTNEAGGWSARIIALGLDGHGAVGLFAREPKLLHANQDLATIVDVLPDDPDHVLIRAIDPEIWVWALYKVNIRDGSPIQLERGSLDTTWWWIKDGVPVLRSDVNASDTVATILSRPKGQSGWKVFGKFPFNAARKLDFEVASATADPNTWLVITTLEGDGARCLRKFDLVTSTIGDVVLQRPDRDVSFCALDKAGRLVAAACIEDRVDYEFADKTLAPDFRAMNDHFKNDANVVIADVSADHNRMLAYVSAPNDAGGYYFYDRATRSPRPVDRAYPWLDGGRLARMEMLEVKAKDGLALRAYLTTPPGSGPKPLVVMPHGGPQVRDSYDYDTVGQVLAAQGWLVLQVNFRGSGGYGRRFLEAGWRHWGDLMQQDVEDATDQVLATGRVDPKRVAIWGWSYGGYAALMGAVRRPELYKAAVSGAGVADLATVLEQAHRGDVDHIAYDYDVKQIGDPTRDGALIAAASPVKHAAAIKAPVLLIHGTKDRVVDPAQSREMRDALQRAGKPVTYVELKDADHGFVNWDLKTMKTMLQTSVDFIGKAFA